MNLYGLLGFLLILVAQLACADSIRFVRVTGGPPLPGASDAKTELGMIQGGEFDKIRGQVQRVIGVLVSDARWLPDGRAWWDVGPDAGYISAIVEMNGKTYTINSWYPVERLSATIAVSETRGIVPVKSREEKDKIESRNSPSYRKIVSIFAFIPERRE